MKDNYEINRWNSLLVSLDETEVHFDYAVFWVLEDLRDHDKLKVCHSDDLKYAIADLENSQHFCECDQDRKIVQEVMAALAKVEK